ncbi:MAG: methylated-DNA--[protein]-cysteine S-methyltransferase [Phenylobacterium sp.]|uniref:methylated-DNA--[protein]-cysteine S-methyltransferase n=1 Tax=Phenylobacterium sp. TaxID=1871053 RepID=UPI0027347001|nr:methylated-DNA--[protein]-cysteine S-methyltransferase [Phenylobacterium sp.]MDP3173447.1 methylated-DNA--[protein]-cysteine S-methyltransferase [Phenylobacterium sp.]
MTTHAYSLFDSAIGVCAVAWSVHGVSDMNLPEGDETRSRARMMRRRPQAVETAPDNDNARAAIDGVRRLLSGERIDLTGVVVDLTDCEDFERSVYAVARTVPAGATITYGEIAQRIGAPRQAREVGQALGRNPVGIIVPCHRVLAAGGKPGGFTAHGGVATKLKLLSIEGAVVGDAPTLFDIWR